MNHAAPFSRWRFGQPSTALRCQGTRRAGLGRGWVLRIGCVSVRLRRQATGSPTRHLLARRRRLARLLHLLSMLRVSWSNAAIGVVETVGGCRRARWRGRSPVATLMGVMPAARNDPQAGALTAGSGRCSRAALRWCGPGFRFPAAHAGTPRRIAPCCRVPRRCLG